METNKKKETSASNAVISGLLQAPFYPFAYVKVLIQVGHEPLPPFKSRSLFGREQYFYPNSFTYLRYIKSVEGISGLYRGLGMKILSHSVGTIVYDKVLRILDDYETSSSKKNEQKEQTAVQNFIIQTSKEVTARCWAVVISHPFHVMGLRCMAQFIGGETKYSSWNIFQNSTEIYNSEGILGFFAGLIPRLLFEASTIAITNALAYIIKSYLFEDKDYDALIDLFASLLANSATYPLSLVSTVSSISGSALVAGRPPRMAVYGSWMEVFKHLYENNELKRGASSIFRVYTPGKIVQQTGFTLNGSPNIQAAKALKSR